MKYDEYVKSLNMKDLCDNDDCPFCNVEMDDGYETLVVEIDDT